MSAAMLTILSSHGKYATKQFTRQPDGTIKNRGYDNETHFAVETIPINGVHELARELERVAGNPYGFVIRGEPLPNIHRARCRRLLHPDKKSGDPATFREEPRHHLIVDIDHIPCPAAIDPRSDPEGAVEYVIGLLPPELHDATCWWQMSSSQCVFDDAALSVHLWFWSERALSSDELKRWGAEVNRLAGYRLVDTSLYNPVQAHYLATPIFTNLPDPLSRRTGLRQGLDDDVSLLIPAPDPKLADQPCEGGWQPGKGIEAYIAAIGGTEGFREPIKAAIASFVAINGSKADATALKAAIRAAVLRADTGGRDEDTIERYADEEHLDAIIEWARLQQGDRPGVKARQDVGAPHLSESWLALKFVGEHGDELRYVAQLNRWYTWNGNIWIRDTKRRVFSLAHGLCRNASREAEKDSLRRNIAEARTRAAVISLAGDEPPIAAGITEWDADPFLLGTPRGVVDLRTGQMREAVRRDYVSKMTRVSPGGECPLWLATLNQIFDGNAELIGYLHRLAGYCLTGSVREEIFVFCHGVGGTGKGTVIETLLWVVGDYGTTIPMTTLIQTNTTEHPTEIAKLWGVRLAIASETREGDYWDTARIKLLTGGDQLTGRFMRADYFDFDPTHKTIASGNNRPNMSEVDEAVRRRLQEIPFQHMFTQPNRMLKANLRSEGGGILQWMINGAVEWYRDGLNPPAAVVEASNRNLAMSDDINGFIDDCCARDVTAKTLATKFYPAWVRWCGNRDRFAGGKRDFTRRIAAKWPQLQYDAEHGTYLLGLRLARAGDP